MAQTPEPILSLGKCLIRSYCATDAEATAKAANNPKIAKWMRNVFPHPYAISDAHTWISIASPNNFAICTADDDTVIGAIGLKPKDDVYYRTYEIGYWLSEEYSGQGIMSEVVIAFTQWAFERHEHLLRLEAEVFDGNKGSARVLEKAGYEFEARKKRSLEKNGVVMDGLTYCKFRPS